MTVLATDNFVRADAGTLGANWIAGLGGVGTGWAIASNQALAATTSPICMGCYSAVAAPNDGYAEVTVGTLLENNTDQGVGPMYRASRTVQTAYFVQGNTVQARFYKVVNGTFTQLGVDGPAVTTGDVIRITVSGTTITITQNGIVTMGGPVTDASIASGDAGMFGAPSSGNNTVSLWSFGDLNAGSTATVAWLS